MKWKIKASTKIKKHIDSLPENVRLMTQTLFRNMEIIGPTQPSWPNYSKLKGLKGIKKSDDVRHCHLQGGRPTYVACWKVHEKEMMIEVTYVGTHEKAPY